MNDTVFVQFMAFLTAAFSIPAFVFAAYWFNHREMGMWRFAAGGYGFILLGSGLAAARSLLPEFVAIFLSNASVGVGYFLCLQTLRILYAESRFRWLEIGTISVYLVLLSHLIVTQAPYEGRVFLVSTYIALMSFYGAVVAMRGNTPVESKLGDATILVFTLGNAFFAALRALAATGLLAGPAFDLATWDAIFFLWSFAAVFSFALGIFIHGTVQMSAAARERAERERGLAMALEKALEESRDLQKLILHELKRPLNGIRTTLQMIQAQGTLPSKEATDQLASLSAEADTFLSSIGEFDEISSVLEAAEFGEVSLADVATDIQSKWGVETELSESARCATVLSDQFLLDIALGNLIDNANKFGTNPANTRLKISIEDNFAVFDIYDDGPGIAPQDTRKVFQRFFRSEANSQNAVKGYGLGLYIVDEIAKLHAGHSCVLSSSPSVICFAVSLEQRKV